MSKPSRARAFTATQKAALRRAARDEMAIRSFASFAREAWPVVEQGVKLTWNWHLQAIAEELEAFVRPLMAGEDGEDPTVRTLVISVPPRSLKSYMTGVCLQPWMWLHAPWIKLQGISNDDKLSMRDSRRVIELITDPWYQGLVLRKHVSDGGSWSDKLPWGVSQRQAAKANFMTTAKGARVALGIRSSVTGKGADIQLIDDPVDAKAAIIGSPQQIKKRMEEVYTTYEGALKSRLNSPKRSLRLVIMQRLHPDDLAGILIRQAQTDPSIRIIVIPMEYDPDFPQKHGGIYEKDPRTKKGELLMEKRWPQSVWDAMKNAATKLLRMSVQAQYNQRPESSSGGLFKSELFRLRYQGDPRFQPVDETIIFVDATFKGHDKTDFVVCQVWGRLGEARFYLLDQYRKQMTFTETLAALQSLKAKWPTVTRVVIEDKANGPALVDVLKQQIRGIQEWSPGTKSKYERAQIGSLPLFEAGQIYLPTESAAPWISGYVQRHVDFDGGGSVPDDEVDGTSMMGLYWSGRTQSANQIASALTTIDFGGGFGGY